MTARKSEMTGQGMSAFSHPLTAFLSSTPSLSVVPSLHHTFCVFILPLDLFILPLRFIIFILIFFFCDLFIHSFILIFCPSVSFASSFATFKFNLHFIFPFTNSSNPFIISSNHFLLICLLVCVGVAVRVVEDTG